MTDEEMKMAKRKYTVQKVMCKNRVDRNGNPIEMRLTFEEWLDIWLTSGHWHERGNNRGQYVMARKHDTGHYEIGNVEIKTIGDNVRENIASDQWRENNKLAMQKLSDSDEWRANQKAGCQQRSDSAKWRENVRLGAQKRSNNAEWHRNRNLALQKVYNTVEWRENNKLANQKKADSAKWREKHKEGVQKRSDSAEWRENTKLANQKNFSKKISCDGVFYESITQAALALAPTHLKDKIDWFYRQMKKYPDRYFYITEDDK